MLRNFIILSVIILAMIIMSLTVDSTVTKIIISSILSIFALLGCVSVCLVAAPVCIPAFSVGIFTFLIGLGLSTSSALIILGVFGIVALYITFKFGKVIITWVKKKFTKTS